MNLINFLNQSQSRPEKLELSLLRQLFNYRTVISTDVGSINVVANIKEDLTGIVESFTKQGFSCSVEEDSGFQILNLKWKEGETHHHYFSF